MEFTKKSVAAFISWKSWAVFIPLIFLESIIVSWLISVIQLPRMGAGGPLGPGPLLLSGWALEGEPPPASGQSLETPLGNGLVPPPEPHLLIRSPVHRPGCFHPWAVVNDAAAGTRRGWPCTRLLSAWMAVCPALESPDRMVGLCDFF